MSRAGNFAARSPWLVAVVMGALVSACGGGGGGGGDGTMSAAFD
jgi:hypothetical protein